MISSPDLLAFTATEEFGEEEQEVLCLPEELSVPHRPTFHPWSTKAKFHRDFILVAEFSEQVGPKPVLTIPDNQKVIGSFDLNQFSVRIMSVDYQASGPSHAPPSSPGPRLNFSEDSKVILGDSADDAFAYVQHLTLYDLEARGMVRPFCMAYVCSDQTKLMENFAELSASFSQASDSLKTGNRQAFSTELRRKLQELEYARLSMLQKTEPLRSNDSPEAEELEAVERLILNHRELLRQVTSYPNRKLKQPDFLPYDPADSLADPLALLLPDNCSSVAASREPEHHLKPLEELCNSYFLSLMKERLADTERRLRGDRSLLRTAGIARALSRKLKITNFLFELLSPEDVEEMEGAEAERQEAPRIIQSEPQSLESFFSCVEEIPIKLEALDGGTVTPDLPAAVEIAGSVSSGESIEVLGTEKSYRTQAVAVGSESRETPPVGGPDVSARCLPEEAGARRVRVCAKRANSEDSIEVLSTTESIVPDDLSAISEEESHSLTNGFKNEDEALFESRQDKDPTHQKADSSDNEPEESVAGDSLVPKEDSNNQSKEVQGAEPASERPDARQKKRLVPHLHVNFASPVAVPEFDHRSLPSAPVRLLSVDETSDCVSFAGSSDTPSPTPSNHGKTFLGKKRRKKAGLRALRFIKQQSFARHAVFCLLSGRPLVVVGGDESLVRKLVDALSLFVPAPGPDGGAVMPCLTTPLLLTDLLTWRLIGIHRLSSISSTTILLSLSRYSRYLAVLDLDQRTLRSPPYSGSLLNLITNPLVNIRRGVTYLLHVESCLTALSNQALHQTFIPVSQNLNGSAQPGTGENFLQGEESHRSESDLKIMRFLSDLIKQYHAGRGPPCLRFSYCSADLHKNTITT